eukprot:3087471-Rhodomonas_salina.4
MLATLSADRRGRGPRERRLRPERERRGCRGGSGHREEGGSSAQSPRRELDGGRGRARLARRSESDCDPGSA